MAIIRPFNTNGPRRSRRAVITAQALTQTEARLRSLAPTRNCTYVPDLLDAFIAVAGCDAAVGRGINIGTGREISIGDLVHKITGIVAREDLKLVTNPERVRPAASEVQRSIADASTARELLGWESARQRGRASRRLGPGYDTSTPFRASRAESTTLFGAE